MLRGLIRWFRGRHFRRKAKAARATGTRYYGDGGTIHRTGHLHVETFHGTVVAVWYRCQPLPFKQTEVDGMRATEMERMYGNPENGRAYGDNGVSIHGVEVRDPERHD